MRMPQSSCFWFDADWTAHLNHLGTWPDGVRGRRLIKQYSWVPREGPYWVRHLA